MRTPSKWIMGFMLGVGSLTCWAANLVINPDFDTDLSGWITSTNGTGTVNFISYDGSPTAGALQLTANAVNDAASAQQCVATTTQNVDFYIRTFASLGGGSTAFSAVAFNGAGCSGINLGTAITYTIAAPGNSVAGVSSTWSDKVNPANTNQALPAGTASVLLKLEVIGDGSSAFYLIDHVRFGSTGTTPVTLQSFHVE